MRGEEGVLAVDATPMKADQNLTTDTAEGVARTGGDQVLRSVLAERDFDRAREVVGADDLRAEGVVAQGFQLGTNGVAMECFWPSWGHKLTKTEFLFEFGPLTVNQTPS